MPKLRRCPSLLWLPLGGLLAAAAGAAEVASQSTEAAQQAPNLSTIVDKSITMLRLAIAAAALITLYFARKRRGSRLSAGQRKLILGILAALSLGANYNFFVWPHLNGFHTHDVYHYYVGAKYFPELGYSGLYECSAAALVENHPELSPENFKVRDLRSNVHRVASEILPGEPRCDGAFSPERWLSFRTDVEWFGAALGPRRLFKAFRDYGYNPSPVWTLVGRPIAEVVPAQQLPILLLARIDLVLAIVAFATVAWAFGFEGFCLAAIAWGANPLSRYQWVGDAFLRYGWLSTSVIGICLLAKRKHAAAGALLALAALLRLFPALFILSYGVWGLRRCLRDRALGSDLRRFAVGAGTTTLILLAAAPLVSGRGLAVYTEFAENMGAYSQEAYWNSVGLRPLLWVSTREPEPEQLNDRPIVTEDSRKRLRNQLFQERRPLFLLLALLAVGSIWRACGRCRDWEAAALGFPLILIFTPPPTYYMSCIVPLALVASRRPKLAVALFLALAGWSLGNIVYYHTATEFAVASAIAIALGGFMLLELQRPAEDTAPGPDTTS